MSHDTEQNEQWENRLLTFVPSTCYDNVLFVFIRACRDPHLLQAEVSALEQQLYALAGRPFNLRSPKERSAVIYDELGLNPKAKGVRKTKSGSLSTSM